MPPQTARRQTDSSRATNKQAGAVLGVLQQRDRKNLVMAGAAQVPKHDWSLPTRPGLEIEDVSALGTSLIDFFLVFSREAIGNRQEHLELNIFEMKASLSSVSNPWSERCPSSPPAPHIGPAIEELLAT